MKNMKTLKPAILLAIIIASTFITSCSDNDTNETNDITVVEPLNDSDKEALLFMLEEEKLARDTYEFLDNQWGINQFANIKKSEQSHMDAVAIY